MSTTTTRLTVRLTVTLSERQFRAVLRDASRTGRGLPVALGQHLQRSRHGEHPIAISLSPSRP